MPFSGVGTAAMNYVDDPCRQVVSDDQLAKLHGVMGVFLRSI